MGSEMCIRDRAYPQRGGVSGAAVVGAALCGPSVLGALRAIPVGVGVIVDGLFFVIVLPSSTLDSVGSRLGLQ